MLTACELKFSIPTFKVQSPHCVQPAAVKPDRSAKPTVLSGRAFAMKRLPLARVAKVPPTREGMRFASWADASPAPSAAAPVRMNAKQVDLAMIRMVVSVENVRWGRSSRRRSGRKGCRRRDLPIRGSNGFDHWDLADIAGARSRDPRDTLR